MNYHENNYYNPQHTIFETDFILVSFGMLTTVEINYRLLKYTLLDIIVPVDIKLTVTNASMNICYDKSVFIDGFQV